MQFVVVLCKSRNRSSAGGQSDTPTYSVSGTLIRSPFGTIGVAVAVAVGVGELVAVAVGVGELVAVAVCVGVGGTGVFVGCGGIVPFSGVEVGVPVAVGIGVGVEAPRGRHALVSGTFSRCVVGPS